MKSKRNKEKAALIGGLLVLVFFIVWFGDAQRSSQKTSATGISAKASDTVTNGQQPLRSTGIAAVSKPPSAAANVSATTFAVSASTNQLPALDTNGQLSASALKQIAALETEKASESLVQRKIDSQLLYADKMRQGVPIAEGVPTQRVDLDKDGQGRILVDITANVTDALLQYIKTIGGIVINDFPQYQAIRAAVPLENIESLAARSEVKFVQPAVRAITSNVDSQGDYTHQATNARSTFGVNGSGLKIGVLSSSVDYLTNSQINGLVTVLPGQSGIPGTGEGTAMLEIVNDLAPGAQLYFATGSGGEANFANNIQQLQAAGCNIIADDELYDDESPFQDGIVAQAVNSVTTNGVLYFSSASNSGNQDDGTSGTWEGDFVNGGAVGFPTNGLIHSFGSANYDTVTQTSSEGAPTVLFWSDPWGASSNDYDLFVLDSTGSNIVSSSVNWQVGAQYPIEGVPAPSNGERLVVILASGTNRFLHLDTERGVLAIGTQGSTRGHDCASNAFDVAATSALNSYPDAFTGGAANPVETFSSDGPRRVFYLADGTPITPGNFSSTGGTVRQKPDFTAADGVTTDVPGFAPFYGTSAATPHAAAIAALLESYNTNLTPSQVRLVLTNTALYVTAPGWNRDAGAGIVMALAALQAVEPDLTRYSDNLNSLSPYIGETVTASLVITNQFCSLAGNNVGAFHVGFYWSSSSSFSGVSPFYEAPITGCAANGSVSLNQNITISTGNAPGTYYLGYKINDENEVTECNTANNGIFYWTVTVLAAPEPNLARETDSLNNLNPHPGNTVTASITITNEPCNGGSSNAGPFHVGFYWSTSSSFTGVSPFYQAPITGCAANGSVSLNQGITIGAGTAPGTYYLGYEINDENEVTECSTANNFIYYWTVTVTPTSPTVNISYGGGNAVLSWPTNFAGYMLEYTTNLATGNWLTNSSTPIVVNGLYTITNAATSGTRFYRLVSP